MTTSGGLGKILLTDYPQWMRRRFAEHATYIYGSQHTQIITHGLIIIGRRMLVTMKQAAAGRLRFIRKNGKNYSMRHRDDPGKNRGAHRRDGPWPTQDAGSVVMNAEFPPVEGAIYRGRSGGLRESNMMSFLFDIGTRRRKAGRFIGHVRRQLLKAFLEEQRDRDLTRDELAQELGVHKSVITRRFNGSGNLTLRVIAEMADALGRDIHFSLEKPVSSAEATARISGLREPPMQSDPRNALAGFVRRMKGDSL